MPTPRPRPATPPCSPGANQPTQASSATTAAFPIHYRHSSTIRAPVRRRHDFIGTTLVDWLHTADSNSRVLSVSRKDRGAILPVGRVKGSVFWWANGAFTTSRYYADTLPTWVRAFNDRKSAESLAGTTWNLLLPASSYAEPDSMIFENSGADFVFPHQLPDSPEVMRTQLAKYPWMDSVTIAFALEGARTMKLGRRGATDVLSISLSTTDAVGHAFGPDSRELHDHLLHLDRWFGYFLDSLARLVPAERTVFVLTGDHGITSFPEYIATVKHQPAARVSLDGLVRETAATLSDRFAMEFGFDFKGNGLFIADTAAMHARGLSVDSIANTLAAQARAKTGVLAVYTPKTIVAAPATDINAMRWRHAIPKETSWLFCVVLKPGYVWSGGKLSAEHGTMGDETVNVPIAFWGRALCRAFLQRPSTHGRYRTYTRGLPWCEAKRATRWQGAAECVRQTHWRYRSQVASAAVPLDARPTVARAPTARTNQQPSAASRTSTRWCGGCRAVLGPAQIHRVCPRIELHRLGTRLRLYRLGQC